MMEPDAALVIGSKPPNDVEIQVQELGPSKEETEQINAFLDEWDAPDNKENPRNWSACEWLTTVDKDQGQS